MTLTFLLTSLIVVASPGTGVVITLAAGLSRGMRAAIVAAIGCTLGIIPHMLAAITGLAVLFHANSLAFETIRVAGVVYLLYMAWMTLREHGTLKVDPAAGPRSDKQVIIQAVLANLLNPKLSIFFFAFLPQFVGADERQPTILMLELSGIFMLMTLVVFAVYGGFAAAMRDHVLSRPRVLTWLRRSFAAAFVGLGVKLALTER